jgi:hypothetical protein
MPGDRTSRSLDESLAIPTRVLRLEAFGAVTPKIPSLKKMLATIRIFISKVNEFE